MMDDGKGQEAITSLVDGDKPEKAEQPSVLIACIGAAFMEGVREAALAAGEEYGARTGAPLEIVILPNLTVIPPLGLGAMHNFMVRRAWLMGYDYLLLLHNDVLLGKDTLLRLVRHGRAYITPWFDQSPYMGEGRLQVIHDPMFKPGQGLRLLNWSVPYCILLRRDALRVGDFAPFTDSMIYHQDCYDSSRFRCAGVDIWQDTDTTVKLLRGPRMLSDHLKELSICRPFEHPGRTRLYVPVSTRATSS